MKKKIFSAMLVLLLVCQMVMTGCSSSGNDKEDKKSTGKDKIVVANWQSYATDAEYGAAKFEEETGCEVEHYFISSIPELLSVLQNGGTGNIDVVCINPLYLQQYLSAGVLEALDTDKLENFKNVREDFRSIDEVKDKDGNIIGVPWVWGTTSLFYNPDIVKEEITSWSALWDPKYKDVVTLENEYDAAIRTAAMYVGEDPKSPDMDKVQSALTELKSNVKTYWTSHDDFLKAYTSGEIAIGNVWGSIATELSSEGYNIKYVHPDEGTVGWCDYWCIVKGTEKEELAYKWIDYCIGEEFQNSMGTAKGQAYAPVNTNVTDKLSNDAKKALWMYPEAPENVNLALPLSDEDLKVWTGVWDKIKAGN